MASLLKPLLIRVDQCKTFAKDFISDTDLKLIAVKQLTGFCEILQVVQVQGTRVPHEFLNSKYLFVYLTLPDLPLMFN